MPDLERDPASRQPWPVPKLDPHQQPLTEGHKRIIDAIPMRDPLPTALAIASRPAPRIVPLGPEPEGPKLCAKPLEWEPQGADDYADKHHGFYIAHQPDDEPDYRWMAAWGEGDSANFATLDEAKAWCQAQIDGWVREFVVVGDAPT